jgi:hypothetical protein
VCFCRNIVKTLKKFIYISKLLQKREKDEAKWEIIERKDPIKRGVRAKNDCNLL